MIRSWLRVAGSTAMAAALAVGLGQSASADTVTVYANNPTPGDFVTGTGDAFVPIVGSSGWTYSDLRQGTTIGINATYAHDGNGSVSISTSTNSSTAKASIAYYFASGNAPLLSTLSALSYDWMVASAPGNLSEVTLRLLVMVDDKYGELVWEPLENGLGQAPGSGWHTSNVIDNGGWFWSSSPGLLSIMPTGTELELIGGRYWGNLDDWQDTFSAATVIGINAGVGSGAPNFVGAVDNITFGFDGTSTTYNFEVVPEPSSIALVLGLGGIGLAGRAWRRRRTG